MEKTKPYRINRWLLVIGVILFIVFIKFIIVIAILYVAYLLIRKYYIKPKKEKKIEEEKLCKLEEEKILCGCGSKINDKGNAEKIKGEEFKIKDLKELTDRLYKYQLVHLDYFGKGKDTLNMWVSAKVSCVE